MWRQISPRKFNLTSNTGPFSLSNTSLAKIFSLIVVTAPIICRANTGAILVEQIHFENSRTQVSSEQISSEYDNKSELEKSNDTLNESFSARPSLKPPLNSTVSSAISSTISSPLRSNNPSFGIGIFHGFGGIKPGLKGEYHMNQMDTLLVETQSHQEKSFSSIHFKTLLKQQDLTTFASIGLARTNSYDRSIITDYVRPGFGIQYSGVKTFNSNLVFGIETLFLTNVATKSVVVTPVANCLLQY